MENKDPNKIQLFQEQKVRTHWDEEFNTNWGTICTLLPMLAADGKMLKTCLLNLTAKKI